MPDVQIIGLPQSNFVWATRIALAEKGVAHQSIPAPPHSPDVVAIHPFGKIPILRHGSLTICESRAIIDYVDSAFEGPKLVPADPEAARHSDSWTSMITSTVEPMLIRQYLFAYFFPTGADGRPDQAAIEALMPKMTGILDVLEAALAQGDLGQQPFGRVDAYLVPILFYTNTMPEGAALIGARPQLAAYLARSLTRPSVQETMPPPAES
ncbi:glutathione S-transferase family protein [Sandaracinobacteroides saxicola]|uniref:Glutathione S-transferase family protein n=1 Tax=Sandaracinobacteroides saxicola TaxID=2759707 RepID=A0A7G5IDZ5_9SPHN|nr:glutathione S-transferase family protein [Sandaracinobacteroides saxicola]QMW21587.1 glutathione S-transferase family protein [Sandaracinobacteroides saxicola]